MEKDSDLLIQHNFLKDIFFFHYFQNTSDLVLIVKTESLRILSCNPRTVEVLGAEREEEIVGTNFLQWVVKKNDVKYEIEKALLGTHTEAIRLVTITGYKFKAKLTFKYCQQDDQHVYLCVIYDNTYNRKLNYLLQETQQIARIGSWEYDLITNKLFCTGIARLLNHSGQDLVFSRNQLFSCFSSENRRLLWQTIQETIQEKFPFDIELKTVLSYPHAQWVRITGRLITRHSKTIKLIGTVQDISAQKFNELQLIESHKQTQEAKKMADKMAQTKSQFLSNISHEIRTPLNAIVSIAHLLLDEKPKKNQIKKIQTLQFAANNLVRLMNDVLDFAKIEAGKVVFEKMPFDIRALVDNLLKFFTFSAKKANQVVFRTFIDPAVPSVVIGDSVRLNQILTNLLSNASKFTEQGSITVSIKLLTQTQDAITLLFSVDDTGIGIPADKLDTIFEVFTQASADTTRKYGGTGLGLAITKNLVEQQGGKIRVVSEVGKGTSFAFDLSFGKVQIEEAKNTDNQNNGSKAVEKIKLEVCLLLVEDNEVNQFVAMRFFKQWGIKYDLAQNSQEAIVKIQSKKYDLVLMDIHLPDEDGFETTKKIRKIEEKYFQHIPIIALTASVMDRVNERTQEAGMNDFLLKPFNPTDLHQKIIQYAIKFKNLLTFEPDKFI
jgi:signal transduction histidine kinase/ActR/RegA family two-component response regulator